MPNVQHQLSVMEYYLGHKRKLTLAKASVAMAVAILDRATQEGNFSFDFWNDGPLSGKIKQVSAIAYFNNQSKKIGPFTGSDALEQCLLAVASYYINRITKYHHPKPKSQT